MGKQVIAAIVSVLLAFGAIIIPYMGMMVSIFTSGSAGQNDPRLFAGALSISFAIFALAGVISFLSLFYLKLHYGTMAMLGIGSVFFSGAMISAQVLNGAIAGIAIVFLLSAAVTFGLWCLLRWVYATPVSAASAAEEF
jgi:hypothetical protein